MVSSTTPRLEARCPPVLETHCTIRSRSSAATWGSFSLGTFFRSSGERMPESREEDSTLRSPRRDQRDDAPQRFGGLPESGNRGQRFAAEAIRTGHRLLHPECGGIGQFAACPVLADTFPHLLEASGFVQDVIRYLEQKAQRAAILSEGLHLRTVPAA